MISYFFRTIAASTLAGILVGILICGSIGIPNPGLQILTFFYLESVIILIFFVLGIFMGTASAAGSLAPGAAAKEPAGALTVAARIVWMSFLVFFASEALVAFNHIVPGYAGDPPGLYMNIGLVLIFVLYLIYFVFIKLSYGKVRLGAFNLTLISVAGICAVFIYGNSKTFPTRYPDVRDDIERITTSESELQRVRTSLKPPGTKVMVIGVDAADWTMMDVLMKEGKLPNFKRLVDTGYRYSLETYLPTYTPLIWNSIVSGKHPDKTGITSGIKTVVPGSKTLPYYLKVIYVRIFQLVESFLVDRKIIEYNLYAAWDLKCKRIWEIADEMGLSSGTVGFHETWPAYNAKHGYFVSDSMRAEYTEGMSAQELAAKKFAWPPELLKPLLDLVQSPADVTDDNVERFLNGTVEEASKGMGRSKLAEFRTFIALDNTRENMTHYLLSSQEKPGLFMVYFYTLDPFQHLTWQFVKDGWRDKSYVDYRYPELNYVYQDSIAKYYQHMDEVVGKLTADTENTTYFIVSDHGFEHTPYQHYRAPPGILLMAGKHIRRGKGMESTKVVNIVPTILFLLNLPQADDMDGRILSEALDFGEEEILGASKIPTYETGPAEKPRPAGLSNEKEELLRQLKALGYIK